MDAPPQLGRCALAAACLFTLAAADPEVKQGISLFEQLEYDRAVVVLGRALTRSDLSRPDQIEGLEALAFAYSTLKDQVHAEQTFHRLLDVDPSYRVDPSRSPRFRDAFSEAQRTWEAGRKVGFIAGSDRERIEGRLDGVPERIGSVVVLGPDRELGRLDCTGARCTGPRPAEAFWVEIRDHQGTPLGRFGPYPARAGEGLLPWWGWAAIGAGVIGLGAVVVVAAQPGPPEPGSLGTLQLP